MHSVPFCRTRYRATEPRAIDNEIDRGAVARSSRSSEFIDALTFRVFTMCSLSLPCVSLFLSPVPRSSLAAFFLGSDSHHEVRRSTFYFSFSSTFSFRARESLPGRQLCLITRDRKFFDVAVGGFDPREGRVIYCNSEKGWCSRLYRKYFL